MKTHNEAMIDLEKAIAEAKLNSKKALVSRNYRGLKELVIIYAVLAIMYLIVKSN